MIPTAWMAPLNGFQPRAFNAPPHWREFAMHRFEATRDGQLAHYTDETLRATVPPEGWDDFASAWPAAQPVIDQLRAAARARAERVKQYDPESTWDGM